MSSAEEVLSTPELLELILWHLPMRSLLIAAPLVSKKWQGVTLSPILQRALFFQPDPAVASSHPILNPLLVELFPPFFTPIARGVDHWLWPNTKVIMAMPWAKAPDAFRRAEASWRRMLVRQPPVQTMQVTDRRRARATNTRHALMTGLELRMGVLYDLTVPFIDRESGWFCIRWDAHTDGEKDGKDNSQGTDIAYTAVSAVGCVRRPYQKLSEEFKSAGAEAVSIDFQYPKYYYA
ncbi:hypothetical protein DFH06DRAFT_1482646 [Mycena polygramma]|nr:hypothetical protein DFH06DRAFT_1482646 [Mycena polygramma]